MSAPSTAPPTKAWPWLGEFLASEGQAWLYVFKCMLAFYITIWLAMLFQLEQPSTAMMTVVIVMHPHSGMVLAKGFYRALGTLAGSLCAMLLIAAFPQQRELFVLSLSLWVGLCAGGAVIYRNFMSYGFVLAGYTAGIVALPVVGNPQGVFDSAMMRVSEVLLGLTVAGMVSDAVMPERLRNVLRKAASSHFGHFLAFARDSTGGVIPRAAMESAHLRFVRAAVELENLRSSVIFEDAEIGARSRRMSLLNLRYMAAATSFQSLHHLINRLQRNDHPRTAAALIALYHPVGDALKAAGESGPTLSQRLVPTLKACHARLPALAAELRETLRQDPELLLEFDSGASLLQRFVDELRDFVALEASLRDTKVVADRNVERVTFRHAPDYAAALVAVLRTFLTMCALAVFWFASDWSFGASAMLMATIFAGLMATSAVPVATVGNMGIGYVLGIVASYLTMFKLMPGSEGFPMLILASMPLLLVGPYMTTRPNKVAGIGMGYMMGFVYVFGLKNPMVYSPERVINDGMASFIGLLASIAAFMIIPAVAGSAWQRRRQLVQLRRQVVQAATEPSQGLLYKFESLNRDLFHQIVSHTAPDSEEQSHLLSWGLAVHETGRALIELRQDMQHPDLPPPLRDAMQRVVQALADLYDAPDAARWQHADHTVDHTIGLTAQALPLAHAACQPALAHLYLLRTALRDDESALAPYNTNATETFHAA